VKPFALVHDIDVLPTALNPAVAFTVAVVSAERVVPASTTI